MHWTFDEYDSTNASDILVALELWRLEDLYSDSERNISDSRME